MPTRQAATKVMEITLAHSPDSDDAFMFYALATRKVRTPGMRFTHVLADIETLNQAAPEELYDVTALSSILPGHLSRSLSVLCGLCASSAVSALIR